jgi:hypothetical protein
VLTELSCGKRASNRSLWVPLPTPGAPKRITRAALFSLILGVLERFRPVARYAKNWLTIQLRRRKLIRLGTVSKMGGGWSLVDSKDTVGFSLRGVRASVQR